MSHIGFSKEERQFVEYCASERAGVGSRLGFYASVLVPVILFGCYGVLQRDFVAVTVALVGLLIFVWWRLSAEMNHVKVHRSVFEKVLAHEKVTDQTTTQPTGASEQLPP